MISADQAEKDLADASRRLEHVYDLLCLVRKDLPFADEQLVRAINCTAIASLNCLVAAKLVRKANGK